MATTQAPRGVRTGPDSDDLLLTLARLNRWVSQRASFEVPVAQARLLSVLDEQGPCRVTDLAAADHTSQPTATAHVARMLASGWVTRTADSQDARASVVAITAAGRDTLAGVRRARVAALEPALARLDPADRAALADAQVALARLLAVAAGPAPD